MSLTKWSILVEMKHGIIRKNLGMTPATPLESPLPDRSKPTIRSAKEQLILDAAEKVFAELGFKGATTSEIALRAGIPKANLHYYFPTKEALYRAVTENVLTAWLAAASSFDINDDPAEALAAYIGAKMDMARTDPLGSKIWASEIMRGAPVIEDFLHTTLATWLASREAIIQSWIDKGLIVPMQPRYLIYLIWAATQHYADFDHQITALNGSAPLDDDAFTTAKTQLITTLLRGVLTRYD